MSAAPEVLLPSSADEAVSLFGDGADVTVVGGGTIVLPELTYGRLKPSKALMLHRAGLAGISRSGSTVTDRRDDLGLRPRPASPRRSAPARRTSPTSRSARRAPSAATSAPARARRAARRPPGPAARARRDRPLGGRGRDHDRAARGVPRRSAGAASSSTSRFEEPAAGAFAALGRPHTHDYTALAVSAVRAARRRDPPRRDRRRLVGHPPALGRGRRRRSRGRRQGARSNDVTLHDDALASAWYRERTLPVLVRRALAQLEEAA